MAKTQVGSTCIFDILWHCMCKTGSVAVYLLGQHSSAGVRAAASEPVLILLVPGVSGVNMCSPCLHVVSLGTPASFHSPNHTFRGQELLFLT